MLNIVDPYLWTEHRKIITPEQTHLPALQSFGFCSNRQATSPLPIHIHRNCIEIVYLMKGFQIYQVGKEHFNLTGSDIFIAYPNEPHSSGSFPNSVTDIFWMQIDMTPSTPFFNLDDKSAAELRAALLSLPRIFTGDQALRAALTDAFFSLISSDHLTHSYGVQLFCCALYRIKMLSLSLHAKPADFMNDAITYIHDHLAEPIELDDIAKVCGLSLSRFKVKFKEEIGTTPRDYINQSRIEQAKKLLENGCSVTDAAIELAFSTPNYFSTIFHRYTGYSPTDYIEMYQKMLRDPH